MENVEESVENYPKSWVLDVPFEGNSDKQAIRLGSAIVGKGSRDVLETKSTLTLVFNLPLTRATYDIYVKVPPITRRKSLKHNAFVQKNGSITYNSNFIVVMMLDPSVSKQIGLFYTWSKAGDGMILFHLYLEPSHVLESLSYFTKSSFMASLKAIGSNNVHVTYSNILCHIVNVFCENLRLTTIFRGYILDMHNYTEDFEHFFRLLKQGRSPINNYKIRLDNITSTLRPYQIDAVQFMLHREATVNITEMPFYQFEHLANDLYYYPYFGCFCKRADDQASMSLRGGILADEMGLGKTLELLVLIETAKWNQPIEKVDSFDAPSVCPIKDTVNFLVSQVVVQTEGSAGLRVIEESRKRHIESNCIAHPGKIGKGSIKLPPESIACSECNLMFNKQKMHWTEECSRKDIDFICPFCSISLPPFEVGTTLIVVPQTLLHQWYEEIYRHVKDNVTVYIYHGVLKEGYKHPVFLSQFDIVLCSYETLRQELEFSEKGNKINFRKRNYDVGERLISPLVTINWWRVCMDESQLVEKKSSKTSLMCSKLKSVSKWCITGTPLMTSVNDLYGLVDILSIEPLRCKNFWDYFLWIPYKMNMNSPRNLILKFMSQILWRNSKNDVADQLNLHPIKYEVHTLIFTPLEERLYNLMLFKAKEKIRASNGIRDAPLDSKVKDLPPNVYKSLMKHLVNLRLSILTGDSHGKIDHTTSTPIPFTPEYLYNKLFEQNRVAFEEKTRVYISHLLGAAGLAYLWLPLECGRYYGEALKTISNMQELTQELELNSKPLVVDDTQKCHTYYNYERWLKSKNEKETAYILPVLAENYEATIQRYVRRECTAVAGLKLERLKLEQTWTKFDRSLDYVFNWIAIGVDVLDPSITSEMLKSTKLANMGLRNLKNPYDLYFAVCDIFERYHGDIQEIRKSAEQISKLIEVANSGLIENPIFRGMMSCSHNNALQSQERRNNDDDTPESVFGNLSTTLNSHLKYHCALCKLKQKLTKFTKCLGFSNSPRQFLPHMLSPPFLAITSLFSHYPEELRTILHQSFHSHTQWFHRCHLTVVFVNNLFPVAQEMISRFREIHEACSRLSPGMVVDIPHGRRRFGKATILYSYNREMATLYEAYQALVAYCESERNSSLTRLKYMKSLRSNLEGQQECPVCYSMLKREWQVFPCAHIICTTCFIQLKRLQMQGNKLSCVTCRQTFSVDGVSKVQCPSKPEKCVPAIPGIELNIKFNAIIGCMKNILSDKSNKILVFTSLSDAIDSFCKVLDLADIKHCRMVPHRAGQSLSDFRAGIFKVLIIPLAQGSHGLNLTQANHVIFLEPATNASVAAQAVARVHRIGQYHPVTVHNFVVSGSIEEEIHRIGFSLSDENGWSLATLWSILGE